MSTTSSKEQLSKIAARREALTTTVKESEAAAAEMQELKFQEFQLFREDAKAQSDQVQALHELAYKAMKNGGVIKMNLFVHEAGEEKGKNVEVVFSNSELGNDTSLLSSREFAIERFFSAAMNAASAKLRALEQNPEYTNEVHRFSNGG